MSGKKIVFSVIVIVGIIGATYFAVENYRLHQLCEDKAFNFALLYKDYSSWIKNPEDIQIISEKARVLNDYLSLRSEAQQEFESQEKGLLTKTERFIELYSQWNKQRDEFKLKLGKSSNDDLSKIQQELSTKSNELILIANMLSGELKNFDKNLIAFKRADKNFQNSMESLVETLTSIDQRDQALEPERPSLFKRFAQWKLEQKANCNRSPLQR